MRSLRCRCRWCPPAPLGVLCFLIQIAEYLNEEWLPLGVPHGTVESDDYNGMYIPKGSTVLPNVWWFSTRNFSFRQWLTWYPSLILQGNVSRWSSVFRARQIPPGEIHGGGVTAWWSVQFSIFRRFWSKCRDFWFWPTVNKHMYIFEKLRNYWKFWGRICPGRFYADAGFWMAASHILACFDILPFSSASGEPVLPVIEFTDGLTRYRVFCVCSYNFF